MMLPPALRRFTFTTHITSSVGWVGAVLAFLALAVYKPFGMTDFGKRKLDGQRRSVSPTPTWIYVAGAVAIALALLVVILHLTGPSPTHDSQP